MKLGTALVACAVLLTIRVYAAGSVNFAAKLAPVPPFPDVCAAARSNGIPLTGFAPANPDAALAPGDSVTGLITLHERKRGLTQWLISFQVTTNRPAPSAKPRPPLVLYTSTGHRFEFDRVPARLRVRILGPFPEPNPHRRSNPAVGDASTRISVNQSFLSVGLDQGAAAILRWVQAVRAQGGTNFTDSFEVAPQPFGNDRTNHDATLAHQWHVTPAEERAVTGWDPALDAYFNTVGQTPNLKDILLKVLSLPSVWSFVKNLGVKVDFGFDNEAVNQFTPVGWALPGDASVYTLPSLLTINRHPALAVTLLVTAPRPPLLVCGGVVGFLAENPSDEANYLTLRIISAHCSTP